MTLFAARHRLNVRQFWNAGDLHHFSATREEFSGTASRSESVIGIVVSLSRDIIGGMRCATILLATGWPLLLPPFAGKDRVDDKRPLKEWDHDSSHDTAKECEDYRVNLWNRYKGDGKKQYAERMLGARCIPSDIYPQLLKLPWSYVTQAQDATAIDWRRSGAPGQGNGLAGILSRTHADRGRISRPRPQENR
jgi:hypothetical protein